MRALIEHREAEYRVIFLREREVARRIEDIYLSHCHHDRPPFLDEILDDMWDVMTIIYVDSISDKNSLAYQELDWSKIRLITETGDPLLAAPYLLEVAGRAFFEMFYQDVYLYLIYNQLNFFDRRDHRGALSDHFRLYNSVVTEVW